MKYLLLKNGNIVRDNGFIQGDILIGNNRIMEIDTSIMIPSPDTEVLDVANKYLLPGLIHYDCPFLKGDASEPSNSAIYIALSHGATFLIDIVQLKEETNFQETINWARDSSKPIIADFGFHLRAFTCNRVSFADLTKSFIVEGITSYFIKWKDIEKLEDDHIEQLFMMAAKFKLLIICESSSAHTTESEHEQLLNKVNPNKFHKILSVIKQYGCSFLFLNVTTREELNILFADKELNNSIYASVNLNSQDDIPEKLTFNDLDELWENKNILMCPPVLTTPNSKKSHFIENAKSLSFLSGLLNSKKKIEDSKLAKACEMYATRPAKLLGIFPQKGILERGADADIIVWNPFEPNLLKMMGTNTSLLRKDISAVIVNGRVITDEVHENIYDFHGRYIYRNPVLI